MRFYAGIGSRKTPRQVLEDMKNLAATLAPLGWGLRTGGADGADTAFETGHRAVAGTANLRVYIPWPNYNKRTTYTPDTVLTRERMSRAMHIWVLYPFALGA